MIYHKPSKNLQNIDRNKTGLDRVYVSTAEVEISDKMHYKIAFKMCIVTEIYRHIIGIFFLYLH